MFEAYQIAANLVMDASKVTGPIAQVIKAFEDLMKVQRDVQSGINEMGSGLRASRNAAAGLVTQMQQAAAAAREFGRAMKAAPMWAGGGFPPSGPPPGRAGASPAAPPAHSVVLPPRLLTYGGKAGEGFTMMPGGPGTFMVWSGPGMSRQFENVSPSPDRGALYPYVSPDRGALTPYVSPPPSPIPLTFPTPRVLNPLSDSDLLLAGVAGEQLGRRTLGAIGDIFDAGAEPGALIAKMRASRFTAAQIDQATDLSRQLVGRVPGLTYSQGLDLINQTAAFTGDVPEAIKLTPTLARDAQVLAQYGHADSITQIEQAIKAGELTGLTAPNGSINLPKLTEFVNRLTAVDVASGGTMNMGKYLTGIRQYGTGANAATMDFTTAVLPAFMKIMSESRAGTALASMQQSLSSTAPNTQNKSIMEEQKKIGIRDKNNVVVEGDMLRGNANDWILSVLLPKVKAAGYTTPGQIVGELFRLLPRQTMVRLVNASIFDAGVIQKEADRNRAQILAGSAPLDRLLQQSPLNQVRAFSSALNMLEVTLADPNMGIATGAMRGVTGALLGFSQFAKEHPDIAKFGFTATAGAGTLLYFGTAAYIATRLGESMLGVAKYGAGLFAKNTITPSETIGAAMDGSTIAGRAASTVMAGLAKSPIGKILGPIGLAFALKDATRDVLSGSNSRRGSEGENLNSFVGPGGQEEGGGLVGLFRLLKDLLISKAHADELPKPPPPPVTLQNTTIVNLDGRTVMRSVATQMARALTSNAGPSLGDMRAVSTPPGATGP